MYKNLHHTKAWKDDSTAQTTFLPVGLLVELISIRECEVVIKDMTTGLTFLVPIKEWQEGFVVLF